MNELIFTPLTIDHCTEETEILNYYTLHTTACYATEEIDEAEFARYYKLSDPNTIAYTIRMDGETAGFCLLKPWNAARRAYRYTYEFTIYLKDGFGKKGLGTKSYHFLEEEAARKGMEIHAVMAAICAENTGSCRLCESLGFEKVGELKKVGVKFGRTLNLCYYEKLYI